MPSNEKPLLDRMAEELDGRRKELETELAQVKDAIALIKEAKAKGKKRRRSPQRSKQERKKPKVEPKPVETPGIPGRRSELCDPVLRSLEENGAAAKKQIARDLGQPVERVQLALERLKREGKVAEEHGWFRPLKEASPAAVA